MILDHLFIHLRSRKMPEKFLASRVLSLYGRMFIGAPSPDQIPSPHKGMRERLSATYFDMKEDRPPMKQNEDWKIGMLWATQLRVEEEKQVGKAAFIYSSILCTLLVALGGAVYSSSASFQEWKTKHDAKVAAEEAAEYRAKRADLQKKWTKEIAGFTAQQCLDEANDSRFRSTPEENDRYSALEAGCADKNEQIQAIGSGWSIQKCADYANEGVAMAKKPGSQPVWVDADVFQLGCLKTHDQTALKALLTEN